MPEPGERRRAVSARVGPIQAVQLENPPTDQADRMTELERLLNDPDVPIDADRVWTLVQEIACRDIAPPPSAQPMRP